jgi:hypothetical protein
MNHAYACRKDATGEPPCKQWCGRQDLCLSTRTYPEDYMQSAYEHGLRDGLAHAKTNRYDNGALEARLAECLSEREARQKLGWGYGKSVSDQWLERDITALQRLLADGAEGIDGPRHGPVADGSQKPNDAAAIPCAKAGSNGGVLASDGGQHE